jgi:hypothetical protein
MLSVTPDQTAILRQMKGRGGSDQLFSGNTFHPGQAERVTAIREANGDGYPWMKALVQVGRLRLREAVRK